MVDVRRVPPDQYAGAPATALAELLDACRAADGRDPLDEAARLHLHNHGLAGADLWLAEGGFALARTGLGASALDLAVSPAHRRTGVGRALLETVVESTSGAIDAWSHGDHPGADALARTHGFGRSRELLVMTRPTTSADTHMDVDPRIRGYLPTDEAELLRVNASAFIAHPEQGAMDADNLAERMAEPWFDPDGLLVATDRSRILGFHWTKVHRGAQGEIYVLAVAPEAQGSGIGRALTRAGLAHLARRGCTAVHLYVEGTNAPAIALYRALGFAPDHTHVQYHRA